MVNDMVENIKFVGAVVGLLSGAFLIYDRLLRDCPIVYLGPKEFLRIYFCAMHRPRQL
jgi:hypothetical protein